MNTATQNRKPIVLPHGGVVDIINMYNFESGVKYSSLPEQPNASVFVFGAEHGGHLSMREAQEKIRAALFRIHIHPLHLRDSAPENAIFFYDNLDLNAIALQLCHSDDKGNAFTVWFE